MAQKLSRKLVYSQMYRAQLVQLVEQSGPLPPPMSLAPQLATGGLPGGLGGGPGGSAGRGGRLPRQMAAQHQQQQAAQARVQLQQLQQHAQQLHAFGGHAGAVGLAGGPGGRMMLRAPLPSNVFMAGAVPPLGAPLGLRRPAGWDARGMSGAAGFAQHGFAMGGHGYGAGPAAAGVSMPLMHMQGAAIPGARLPLGAADNAAAIDALTQAMQGLQAAGGVGGQASSLEWRPLPGQE